MRMIPFAGAAYSGYVAATGKDPIAGTCEGIGPRILDGFNAAGGLLDVFHSAAETGGGVVPPQRATVPLAKFRDYIFKEGATHGKDAVFRGLGYGAEHSEDLVALYMEQASAKFARGEYTKGVLDEFGQRVNIEIELPGIGSAAGKTSYLRSGWMIRPDGTITLNTPFSGFTR